MVMAPANKPLIIQVVGVQPVGGELLGLLASNLLCLLQQRSSIVVAELHSVHYQEPRDVLISTP